MSLENQARAKVQILNSVFPSYEHLCRIKGRRSTYSVFGALTVKIEKDRALIRSENEPIFITRPDGHSRVGFPRKQIHHSHLSCFYSLKRSDGYKILPGDVYLNGEAVDSAPKDAWEQFMLSLKKLVFVIYHDSFSKTVSAKLQIKHNELTVRGGNPASIKHPESLLKYYAAHLCRQHNLALPPYRSLTSFINGRKLTEMEYLSYLSELPECILQQLNKKLPAVKLPVAEIHPLQTHLQSYADFCNS